jgi:defect-in-organelle-trafficking protein DotC
MMRKQAKKLLIFVILTIPYFSGQATAQEAMSLEDLQSMDYSQKIVGMLQAENPTDMRLSAMREAALAVGAQHGYVAYLNEVKEFLKGDSETFNNLFDFSVLMKLATNNPNSELYLLPPVIRETRNLVSVSDDATQVRQTGTQWTIHKPERLVSRAPDWRQYLIYDQGVEVSTPSQILLPKTPEEKKLWSSWIVKGWTSGQRQADRELTYRVRRLGNDFIGMVKYMTLVDQGKISKPTLVSSQQSVTGGGNSMREDERFLRLSRAAQLNPNYTEWDAKILDNRDSLRYDIEMIGVD